MNCVHRYRGNVIYFAFCVLFGGLFKNANADSLTFAVYPILPAQEARRAFQPLADYLQHKTGHPVEIITSVNYMAHWQANQREHTALILEGPHMIDYRVKKMKYQALAKIPEVISFSIVAHQDHMIMEPAELVGKTIATMPSPSLGALRLNQFFPNPLRQPVVVEVNDMEQAIQRVMEKEVQAALIPSSMVARYPELSTVATTEQAPAPGIAAAPWVSDDVKRALREALTGAHTDPEGQAALDALRLPRFEKATATQFDGYARLLEGMWGY